MSWKGPPPLVTAVIPVFNGAAFVGDAIRSVLAQSYSSVECVVIDDGSTDETAEAVRHFRQQVRYVRQSNRGVSSARNRGAEYARGTFIAFLDADDVWVPEKLQIQMNLFSSAPNLGLVYSDVLIVDERLSPLEVMPAAPPDVAMRNTLLMQPPIVPISMTAVMPMEVFENVGGFDEELSTSADADFALRVGLVRTIARVDLPLALYRQHAAQMHLNVTATERDMMRIYQKTFGGAGVPDALKRLRRRAHASLCSTLAIAALADLNIGPAIRHVVRAFRWHPIQMAKVFGRFARNKVRNRTTRRNVCTGERYTSQHA